MARTTFRKSASDSGNARAYPSPTEVVFDRRYWLKKERFGFAATAAACQSGALVIELDSECDKMKTSSSAFDKRHWINGSPREGMAAV
ncbi:hypothetical protein ACEPAI_8248 [Sanghuangporus weigelae]